MNYFFPHYSCSSGLLSAQIEFSTVEGQNPGENTAIFRCRILPIHRILPSAVAWWKDSVEEDKTKENMLHAMTSGTRTPSSCGLLRLPISQYRYCNWCKEKMGAQKRSFILALFDKPRQCLVGWQKDMQIRAG